MKKSFVTFLLISFFFTLSQANATLVRPVNLQELAQDSTQIVKVKVLAKDTVMDQEESGTIATYYTFQVLDWIKGTPTSDNELVIKQIGQGQFTLDGYQVRQQFYIPEYEVGKTYVLFLPEAHEKTGFLAPLGLQQGVFDVVEQNGKEIIPQLKARQKTLRSGIEKNTKNQFLLFQMQTIDEEPTYNNFKSMIESAGE